ncbi:type VII secretion target [Phycicoccus duodecadis]|uniref:type VII secretion target n=1 Tax=Phycicoccus duodecadis TaxID=173053 RepID=UPI0013041710|nr:type VII secretion target [Phycicoccus duodecadis]
MSPTGIREHAVSLAGIEGDLRSCSTAAETTLDSSAFGIVNAFLSTTVGIFGAAVNLGIANVAEDMGETVATLRTQATSYETTDHDAGSRVNGAGR